MEPITIGLIAVAAVALLGRSKRGRKRYAKQEFKGDREEVRQWIESRAKAYSQEYNTMHGLSDYLLGVAYGESRFTPTAQNGEERNSARGLFQMRPDTAFRKNNGLEHLRNKPEKLLDRKMAMVTAIDYIAAAGRRAQKEGVQIDWASVRRWWVYPKLLTDFSRTHDRSKKVDRVFPEHLGKAGANPDIFDKIVKTNNYPGIKETAKFFGVKL